MIFVIAVKLGASFSNVKVFISASKQASVQTHLDNFTAIIIVMQIFLHHFVSSLIFVSVSFFFFDFGRFYVCD